VPPQPHRDHGLETDSEGSRLHIRMVPLHDAEANQSADPLEARGGRHTDEFRQPVVGRSSILLQNP
jgi:hypothetical protein